MSVPSVRVHRILQQLRPNATSLTAASSGAGPLDEERSAPGFPVRELTYYLDGGESMTSIRELVQASIAEDPVLNDSNKGDLSRAEARRRSMAKIAQVVGVIRGRNEDVAETAAAAAGAEGGEKKQSKDISQQLPSSEEDRSASRAGAGKASLDPSWGIRIGVHFGLFQSALLGSGTDEQVRKYAKDVQEMRIIGCFAMTEMGHGSYLQGLETTATFDPSTDEFVINTPTVTATKWWIGMAGQTATHAAVFAKLVINGTSHGIQTFLVPIRDLVTGKAAKNVSVGDMGSKMGRNGLDNGWIQFHQKRVPRESMLMRWARVDRSGQFTPPPNRQMAYNALLGTRVELFSACSQVLKKALTIAVRYALVRKQFLRKDDPSKGESKLLDYATHQAVLFPILAHTFALHFCAKHTQLMADQALKALAADNSNLSALPELHATSSGLKAVGTWYANDAIESCRQTLGGMGYSSYAGLASMRADWAVMATWEGDNTVLSLQCARFLTKQVAQISKGKRPGGVAKYIADFRADERAPQDMGEKEWLDPEWQVRAFHHRAARMARDLSRAIDTEAQGKQVSFDVAAERMGAECVAVTRAHCYAYMLQCFSEGVRKAPKELQTVLALLRDIFALQHIESNLGDFLEDGFLGPSHARSLRPLLRTLYTRLRPSALGLVDSFGLPDFVVDSPLGREDGDVYNAIFAAVKGAPGSQGVPDYFEELIRPLTDPNYKKKED